jgi:outer membrane protein TolC
LRLLIGLILSVGFAMSSYGFSQAMLLTLVEAEHLAVTLEPELKRTQANANALDQQAIADGQLADPQLMVGAINVPTDTFSFTQDEMTMIQIGLQQNFPPGHSRAIKSRHTQNLSTAERLRLQEQKSALVQQVRDTWLDLYYWTQAAEVTQRNHAALVALFKAIKSQYSTGKGSLSEVSQIQLEVSRVEDQSLQIAQRIDLLQAQLGRWIGTSNAQRPLPSALPQWPEPPPLSVIETQLQSHPLLKVDSANILAAQDDIALAKEQYKPGIQAGIAYGIRQGNMSDGQPRSDMLTAQVSVDLPFFTAQRQDRQLKASEYKLVSTELTQTADYRDLLKGLQTQYTAYQQLSKRQALYQTRLITQAIQNKKAALLAYQNTTSDLVTVLRAYTNVWVIQLEQLQVQVERAKARAALFYLQGQLS